MRAEGRTEAAGIRRSFILHPSSFILAFVLGAVTVAGFAPFRLFPLPVFTLSVLFYLWWAAGSARAAAVVGFAFGCGLYLCGVSWVYVSLHDFGAMPAPLAGFVTVLFCLYLALFPAMAGYLTRSLPAHPVMRYALLAPALWTLFEWVRGWLFTGFPWLALGYSQIPDSSLAGYAPVLGVYGVTLATTVSAGMLTLLWQYNREKGAGARRGMEGKGAFIWNIFSLILYRSTLCFFVIWLGGWALKQTEWTQSNGTSVKVSLIQGNIAQDLKWKADSLIATLESHRALARLYASPLIILPETALPMFLDQVPRDYLQEFADLARANGGDILIGVPERLPGGEYYNSAVSFGTAPTQIYRKSHLVPFGEFIPLRPILGGIVGALAIPLQDFSRGEEQQRPLAIAGQRVAVNICYEDAFGEEIIRQLPEATLLVNVSNVAWFGRSIAPQQHLQISQARALETGRYLVRATNSGVTAVIDPRGEVVASAPEFAVANVTHRVLGYSGATPYVRWGNTAALALGCVLLALGCWSGSLAVRSATA